MGLPLGPAWETGSRNFPPISGVHFDGSEAGWDGGGILVVVGISGQKLHSLGTWSCQGSRGADDS